MAKSPILGGFAKSRSGNLSDNESYNLFLELVETKDGKVPGALLNAAGLDLIGNLGPGPVRGVLPLNDVLYVVSGPDLYSLTPNGIATFCGSIGAKATPVSIIQNGRQLLVLDGTGAWLVPGGYPLTGGTIDTAGGLYAVNDTITLLASTGTQSSYPIITVTGITNNPVSAYTLPNAGTDYTTTANVPTGPIASQPGVGTDLTLNITAAGGPITGFSIADGGTNYAAGDTGTVTLGTLDAAYQIQTTSGGSVTSLILTNPGTAYSTYSGAPTKTGPGSPTNVGTGFALNITAASGPITASTLANGGKNYAVGNVGIVGSGSADATYCVTAIGANGAVTAFSVSQGGAVNAEPVSFSQQSTSGSGAGLTLTSPLFGAFVGVVPVTMPFANPVMGAISDGFGLAVFQGSQNIAQCNELDLSTWDPLTYGVADQSPDDCMAIAVIHDEAYILKQQNTEVWVDGGLEGFAFQPLTGVHMEYGIEAPFSVVKIGDLLFWLSRNDQGQGAVVRAAAYQVDEVSTQALVAEFDTYPNLGDAIAYGRQQGGHSFYVLTFPEANKTWLYDVTASKMAGYPMWHRLAAFETGAWQRHWGNCFYPWRGSVSLVTETTPYQAQAVKLTGRLETPSGLNGLPIAFAAAVFSVWLDLPDSAASGIVFANQGDSATPGLSIAIQNDDAGSPQITVAAWDASATPIVAATYDFTGWSAWVNLMVSIDTATQQLQVFANTMVSNVLVEDELTAATITWTSSNPIAPAASQPWSLTAT